MHLRLKILGFVFTLHSVSVIFLTYRWVVSISKSDVTLTANSVIMKDLIS